MGTQPARWDPRRGTHLLPWWPEMVGALLGDMDRLFQQAFGGLPAPLPPPLAAGDLQFADDGRELVVRAPLPGVDPAHLEVRLGTGVLYLRGQATRQYRREEPGLVTAAAGVEAFAQTLPLPAPVDAARATARFRDGVLEIRAPRLHPAPASGSGGPPRAQ